MQSGLWDDYNLYATGATNGLLSIGSNVNSIWGIGQGDIGYGQATVLLAKAQDQEPTVNEWQAMYNIIETVANHQDTSVGEMGTTDVELFLDTISNNINSIFNNRLIARSINVVSSKLIDSTGDWRKSATQNVRYTWSDPDKVRYFFNAGGYITVSPSVTDYTSDEKARSWDALTQMCGTIKIGAHSTTVINDSTTATVTEAHTSSISSVTTNIGYYDLSAVETLIFSKTLTTVGSPYTDTAANVVKIYASTNETIGDNADNGTIITLRIVLEDNDTDPTVDPVYTMDGKVRTTVSYNEPSSAYLTKTWATPTTSLLSKTHI